MEFEADCTRAVRFAEVADLKSTLPKLQAAREEASNAYNSWTDETEKLVQAREKKRDQLAWEFNEAEHAVSTAQQRLRETPQAEDLPEEFTDILGRIAACLQQSSRPCRLIATEAQTARFEISRLKAAIEAAETPRETAAATEEFNDNDSRLSSVVATHDAFEARIKQLREFQERSRTELICAETGLFVGGVSADEFFAGLSVADFQIPSHLFG